MTQQTAQTTGVTVGGVIAGTYEITRMIGRGGMGAVYEASHVRLPGKRVAIKVLHGDTSADAEALARFRREAEIASRLGHPNIVEVHDFNLLPSGEPYLVLELLVGESLDARMRRGAMRLPDALEIIRQVGAALAAAHREGVVHRDLKPQNVFLVAPHDDASSDEVAKVLDFGISKIQGSQSIKTQESAILGTPQYMAPEQALGNHAAVDGRTDVFALGVMLYEMLAGTPPFSGQTVPEVVFKIVYEPARPLAEHRPELATHVTDAVMRALDKKPEGRFSSVGELVEALTGNPLSTWRSQAASGQAPAPDPMGATVDSGSRARSSTPEATAAGTDPTMAASDRHHAMAASIRAMLATGAGADAQPHAVADPALAATAPVRKRGKLGVVLALLTVALGAAAATALLLGGDPGSEPGANPALQRAPDHEAAPGLTATSPTAPAAAPSLPTPSAVSGGATKQPDRPKGNPRRPPGPEEVAATQTPAVPATPDRRTPTPPILTLTTDERVADTADDSTPERPGRRSVGDQHPPAAATDDEPAEIRSTLAAGRAALNDGDFTEALRRADIALRVQPRSANGHLLRAKAFCGKKDLGNVRASERNVPRSHRRGLKRFCARYGVVL